MNTVAAAVAHPALRGIILDCDGVIVDSLQANTVFYNTMRGSLGLGPMNSEDAAFAHCHSVAESLRRVIPAQHWHRFDEIRKSVRYTDLIPYLRLEPGLELFLKTARSQGLHLGICTNRTDTMDLILEHYHLTPFFHPVETAASVTFPKPHPEGLNKILRTWNACRHEVVFIGDSVVDERTAAGAGIRFWAYKNDSLRHGMHIPDFHLLSQWLERHGAFRKHARGPIMTTS